MYARFRLFSQSPAKAVRYRLAAAFFFGIFAAGSYGQQDDTEACRQGPDLPKYQKFNFINHNPEQKAFRESIPADAVIGEVTFTRYNVFNLEDQREDNWLYRLANRVNVVTWESVIQSQLLLAPGEPYDPAMLAETERLLREFDFLYDARVVPVRVCGKRVDVEVVTRDIWTLNPTISLSRSGGDNTAAIGITDSNLLGSGKQVGLLFEDDPDRSGYSMFYGDPALFDSRWTLGLTYSDYDDGYYRALEVERPFFSVYEPWSAGTGARQGKAEEATWYRGDEVTEFNHEYDVVELFGAMAIHPEQGNRVNRWRAGLHYETNSFDYSDSDIPPDQLPGDRDYVYPFIGYDSIEDSYNKVRNMNYIGRTEDFYVGQRYNWMLGWSAEGLGATRDQIAFDGYYQTTLRVNSKKMWRVEGFANGFYDPDSGDFENLWLTLYSNYFHRQHHKWTFFASTRIDYTDGLTEDRQVWLGGDTGMRGYERNYQVGDRSFVVSLEERYYSDWHPFRLFRVGAAAFVDVGRAWYDDQDNGANGGTLADVGFGLRLNSSRANKRRVIHVDLAFPLARGDDVDSVQLLFRVRDQF
ncbi:BamA/TamA family outer membrane protein [Haliea sp. E17]|uniref:BamA/TamA family outer membrane protein n=1 Tax=Haliea sp. E17 TaxID=3401576 RepID=UPI003AAA6256